MKKSLLFFAGLLAISFSSSIFSNLFIGVNQTQKKLGVTISLSDGTSQYLELQPYGKNGYINADLNVGISCFNNVIIQRFPSDNVIYSPLAYTLYNENDKCQNLQLEFKESNGILTANKAPYYGFRKY